MNILHYTLGFPPMRSGGLTKYSVDLMEAQKQLGHNVFAIYPGNPFFLFGRMGVCKERSRNEIGVFKIQNALLLPLLHGIKNTRPFIASPKDGLDAFRIFFENNRFDILHVHTMMGLPVSFLISAKESGVKVVYTSHDYFGLCPKVNFINQDGMPCECAQPYKCERCNKMAKPLWYLWLRNSRLLVVLKKILNR